MLKYAIGLTCLLASPLALAHAHLLSSSPADHSVLDHSPSILEASFSEGVETELSTLTLTDNEHHQIKLDTFKAIQSDKGSDDKAHAYQVTLPHLKSGEYTLEMKLTSVDTHRVEYTLHFTVK